MRQKSYATSYVALLCKTRQRGCCMSFDLLKKTATPATRLLTAENTTTSSSSSSFVLTQASSHLTSLHFTSHLALSAYQAQGSHFTSLAEYLGTYQSTLIFCQRYIVAACCLASPITTTTRHLQSRLSLTALASQFSHFYC